MGVFSWQTSDTGESIWWDHEIPTVHMRDSEGNVWSEDDYEGYGVFGGKDFYVLLANMNGIRGDNEDVRSQGISLLFENNPGGSGAIATKRGIKVPTLAFDKDKQWIDLPPPEPCEYQGCYTWSDDAEDSYR